MRIFERLFRRPRQRFLVVGRMGLGEPGWVGPLSRGSAEMVVASLEEQGYPVAVCEVRSGLVHLTPSREEDTVA